MRDGSYIHYTYDAAGTLLRKGYYVGEELTEIPGDDEEELTGFCLPDTHLMSVGDEEEKEDSRRGWICYFRKQQPAGVSFLPERPSGQQPRGGQRQRAGGAGEPLLSLRWPDGRIASAFSYILGVSTSEE